MSTTSFQKQKQSYCHLVILHGSGAGEARCLPMVEQMDADLLKDLRGLGKPPTFDEIDAEYQDFPFSFRIHISLVSSVAKADGQMRSRMESYYLSSNESAGRSIFQMLHTDVLLVSFDTKGSVRTLVRSVEESNGTEACRLSHRRYAPDTQIDAKDHDARETLV